MKDYIKKVNINVYPRTSSEMRPVHACWFHVVKSFYPRTSSEVRQALKERKYVFT